VFQFDTETLKQEFQRLYGAFYPPHHSFPSIKDFNERGCTHIFLIAKSSQWKYEREWRVLMHIEEGDDPEEEGKVYEFRDGLIRGIILGCEMKPAAKRKIRGWIRKYQPQLLGSIYEAIKDEEFYNIRTKPEIK
jgi:hypothetical protein